MRLLPRIANTVRAAAREQAAARSVTALAPDAVVTLDVLPQLRFVRHEDCVIASVAALGDLDSRHTRLPVAHAAGQDLRAVLKFEGEAAALFFAAIEALWHLRKPFANLLEECFEICLGKRIENNYTAE